MYRLALCISLGYTQTSGYSCLGIAATLQVRSSCGSSKLVM